MLWTSTTQEYFITKTMGLSKIYLIGPYDNSVIQHQSGGAIVNIEVRLTFMMMLYPKMIQFEIIKVPFFGLDMVADRSGGYVDKSSTSVSLLFNSTWLCIYSCQYTVVFNIVYEFKRDLNPLLR